MQEHFGAWIALFGVNATVWDSPRQSVSIFDVSYATATKAEQRITIGKRVTVLMRRIVRTIVLDRLLPDSGIWDSFSKFMRLGGIYFLQSRKKTIMSSKYGPVILLEDDADDHEFLQDAYKTLNRKNKLRLFTRAEDVLEYLLTTSEQPFIIISEVQLQRMDGTQLRLKILANDYLRSKSIPFVFFTTHKDKKDVIKAYEMQVQGYFVKQHTMADLQHMLRKILDYWEECVHVNNVDF